MGSTAWHLYELVMGAALMMLGVAAVAGWIGEASRWYSPRLIGTANTALGAALLLYGLLAHYLWAVLVSMTSFAIGVICVVTWAIKAVARRADDEFGSI